MSTLDVLVIGLVAIAVFETILGILRTYLFAHTTNRIDVELGARLFRHLLALPIAYFQARRVGDSVARVRELENIRNFLTSSALTLVIDLFFTFVFLAVMFLYSPLLTFVVLASFPFYIGISAASDAAVPPAARREIPARRREPGVPRRKRHRQWKRSRRWRSSRRCSGAGRSSSPATSRRAFACCSSATPPARAVQLVSKLVTAAVLYFGAKLVIDGELTVGELVAFNILAGRVSAPVLRLAQIWQDFHQARLSVARLGDILNTPAEPSFSPTRAALPRDPRRRHIRARRRSAIASTVRKCCTTSRFKRRRRARSSASSAPPGSGKSTLAKLIQRLYVPESGRVLVDGVDLAMVDTAWLRRQIGVVLQENMLFNRSVRDNIALADPAMPIERVIARREARRRARFHPRMPEGYDTIVGERGDSLSGGQRQRIAIARALVTDPRILIFDEATSALDYESERVIQQNMREIAKGRTVFIIAHRLSTVRWTDRIITIDRGRLVEDGTHDELIRTGGRYATLYRLQAASMTSSKQPRKGSSRIVLAFPAKGRDRDELAFLPAALEIVETPPSPIGRAIALTIMPCSASRWPGRASARSTSSRLRTGKIIPSGRTKVIQPFETGVVRAIHVHDGQAVKAGDVLIELDPTMNEAEREHLKSDLIAAQLDVARLRAALARRRSARKFQAAAEARRRTWSRTQRKFLLDQDGEQRAKLAVLDRQRAQKAGGAAKPAPPRSPSSKRRCRC